MIMWMGFELSQTNLRPQSSMVMPCWPAPVVTSNLSVRGSNRNAWLRTFTGDAFGSSALRTLPPALLVETWKRLSSPQRNELSIASPARSLANPV